MDDSRLPPEYLAHRAARELQRKRATREYYHEEDPPVRRLLSRAAPLNPLTPAHDPQGYQDTSGSAASQPNSSSQLQIVPYRLKQSTTSGRSWAPQFDDDRNSYVSRSDYSRSKVSRFSEEYRFDHRSGDERYTRVKSLYSEPPLPTIHEQSSYRDRGASPTPSESTSQVSRSPLRSRYYGDPHLGEERRILPQRPRESGYHGSEGSEGEKPRGRRWNRD